MVNSLMIRKHLLAVGLGLLLSVSAAAGPMFPMFGPVAGILKGSATSPQTTAATSTDVRALWSGTCDAATFLRGDGACVTLTGVDEAADYDWLGAHTFADTVQFDDTGTSAEFAGNIIVSGIPPNVFSGDIQINSATPQYYWIESDAATNNKEWDVAANGEQLQCRLLSDDHLTIANWCEVDRTGTTVDSIKLLGGGLLVGGTPTGGAQGTGTINVSGGYYVNGVALTTPAAANPTASVGLAAVNGSAGTFMRSDGAPALSQSIAPTWTGTHIWSAAGGGFPLQMRGDTTGIGNDVLLGVYDSGGTRKGYFGDGSNANADMYIASDAGGLQVATVSGGSGGILVDAATGGLQGQGTVNATGLFINGVPVSGGATETGSFTGTMTGMSGATTCTVRYRKTGSLAFVYANTSCIGTSNATTMTMTGLPAIIQPARAVTCQFSGVQDNSVSILANADIGGGVTAGTIQFNKGSVSSGTVIFGSSLWTASGSKGPSTTWSCIYDLDA